ncbi:MAG TPA: tRNA (guanosine(46)-N7)-methyltransferase TrmB [Bacteroidales bacterium]|nr:tRNA (guanosine(46)-N7)-methyltransferase TrmB [Bacteroidales bacterium]
MGKQKLKRFAEINFFPNVIQPGDRYPVEDHPYKGKWSKVFFGNNNPIVLEIGCGKGEYTLALARKFPEINFIGLDIKGDRIWKGAKQSINGGLTNAAFLRIQAERICFFFDTGEINSIWLTFPDPQPQKSREKKRLTSPEFLKRYSKILAAGSFIHLKTDNTDLFEYTLDVIIGGNHHLGVFSNDIHKEANPSTLFLKETQTHYERQFLASGVPIKYLCFVLAELNES